MSASEQERLILKYMPFASNVAGKISAGLPIDYEDARQRAYEGLVEAARRFDISKHDPSIADLDTNFKCFAYLRIYGSIYDEARQSSFVKRRGLEKGMRVHMSSMDEMIEAEDGSSNPRFQLSAIEMDADLVLDVENALSVLTDREYRVVMGLAVGTRGHELADEFGVTESRISQIAGEARQKLERSIAA